MHKMIFRQFLFHGHISRIIFLSGFPLCEIWHLLIYSSLFIIIRKNIHKVNYEVPILHKRTDVSRSIPWGV